jgi:hypothetical protein
MGDFIRESLDIADSGAAFGLLQSVFIAGYACAAVVFGHLVHTHDPFKLMGFGAFNDTHDPFTTWLYIAHHILRVDSVNLVARMLAHYHPGSVFLALSPRIIFFGFKG